MTKYYYTYKITLLCGSLKNHYYFGQHTTKNINDGYCGSGIIINKYYKKYGKKEGETYTKQIINYYNSSSELNEAEYKLIGDRYNSDDMCLNLKSGGGYPGFSTETRCKMSIWQKGKPKKEETIEKFRKCHKGQIPWNKGGHISEEQKQKLKKPKSEDFKLKISKVRKGNPPGNKGMHWKLVDGKRIYY